MTLKFSGIHLFILCRRNFSFILSILILSVIFLSIFLKTYLFITYFVLPITFCRTQPLLPKVSDEIVHQTFTYFFLSNIPVNNLLSFPKSSSEPAICNLFINGGNGFEEVETKTTIFLVTQTGANFHHNMHLTYLLSK